MPPRVLLEAKPTLTPVFFPPIAFILIFGCLFFFLTSLTSISIVQTILGLLLLLMFLAVLFRAALDLINQQTTFYRLSETHLYKKTGFLQPNEFLLPLTNIQDTSLHYPHLGILLNYANLIVTTPGRSVKFYDLPNPKTWRAEIDSRRRP